MKKKNTKLNNKQKTTRQSLVKSSRTQIVTLEQIEKMEKKYDKKFREVFGLLKQLIKKRRNQEKILDFNRIK